jgi:mannosyltransferase
MIDFFFRGIFEHPLLRRAKYVMRLDCDSLLLTPFPDLFAALDTLPTVSYVVAANNRDCGKIVRGLPEFATEFASRHGASTLRSINKLQSERNAGRKANPCLLGFYNNFEILRMADFTGSALHAEWTSAVAKSHGIFEHRWGDAILRRLGLTMMGVNVAYLDALAPHARYEHRGLVYGSAILRRNLIAPG